VDLRQSAPFDWDTLYILNKTIPQIEAEAYLNQPLDPILEFSKTFFFLSQDRVVRQERSDIDIERESENEVVFDVRDTSPGWIRLEVTSKLEGQRSVEDPRHYELRIQ
jgi:hypothetical protein